MKKIIGALVSVFAVFMILVMAVPVSADWNSDLGKGTAVTITDTRLFEVDSFLGVKSYYSENTLKYTASELVVRFYKDAYGGLTVSTSGTPTIATSGYEFKIPVTPQQGDVVYGEGGHWAIVKSYNKSKKQIVIFEQGNAQDGVAYKNRTLTYPSSSYMVLTPRAKVGNTYPTLTNLDTGKKVALNKCDVYDVTSATTAASSAAGSTTAAKTSVPGVTGVTGATTVPDFTTYVSQDDSTTSADSNYTTVSMPEGYEEFFTSDGQSVSDDGSGDGAYDPNQHTQYAYTDTQPYDGNILESTTEPVTEEKKSVNPTLVFGIAMIAGIVCITGAGVFAGLVIKKRNEDD